MASLTFLGAAGTVTGSKYLIDFGSHRVLVDCGLFQGLKELRQRNWAPFPVDPARIDAVVLTHAHLDHCGYLPRLVAQGFRGRIFCTPGTRDLCSIVLPDSAHLQEEEARHANKHGYSRHQPSLPLYTQADASRTLTQLQPVGYNRPVPVVPGLEVEFVNAGHLLGSAYARIRVAGRTLLFGGDLGRYNRPILPDPQAPDRADALEVLLVESTYGDRAHEPDDNGDRLAEIVTRAARRGGKLIIPAFAIGRVEEVIYWLRLLEDEKRIPILPVYIDSPMAAAALEFYKQRMNELDPDLGGGWKDVCAFCTARLTVVETSEQSKAVTASREPSIVIAASGMATGGRVLHHLTATLPDGKNTVLFVGYQAAGTRGRALVDGIHEVKMLGRVIPVMATIEQLDSMSAHADANEVMRWLSDIVQVPKMTYLVHGEPTALRVLAERIARERSWPVHIAQHLERVDLDLG
jgi:metallo-beta-lactamase family protein